MSVISAWLNYHQKLTWQVYGRLLQRFLSNLTSCVTQGTSLLYLIIPSFLFNNRVTQSVTKVKIILCNNAVWFFSKYLQFKVYYVTSFCVWANHKSHQFNFKSGWYKGYFAANVRSIYGVFVHLHPSALAVLLIIRHVQRVNHRNNYNVQSLCTKLPDQ